MPVFLFLPTLLYCEMCTYEQSLCRRLRRVNSFTFTGWTLVISNIIMHYYSVVISTKLEALYNSNQHFITSVMASEVCYKSINILHDTVLSSEVACVKVFPVNSVLHLL